jgi:competence protein ComGF
MFSTKGNIKKNKGVTLIEVVVSLNLVIILISLLLSTFKISASTYDYIDRYATTSISIKEALMFIEQEVDRNCDGIKIEKDTIFLGKNDYLYRIDWGNANKITKIDSTLYFYFKNSSGGFTPQPLLYNVDFFSLEENNKVFFIKIKTKDGTTCEKAFVKKY